jgi:hypothetical protein
MLAGFLDSTEIDPTFLAEFDRNKDGKLSLDEVCQCTAELLGVCPVGQDQ